MILHLNCYLCTPISLNPKDDLKNTLQKFLWKVLIERIKTIFYKYVSSQVKKKLTLLVNLLSPSSWTMKNKLRKWNLVFSTFLLYNYSVWKQKFQCSLTTTKWGNGKQGDNIYKQYIKHVQWYRQFTQLSTIVMQIAFMQIHSKESYELFN